MAMSFALPLIVSSAGLYLLFKLRFFFVVHPLTVGREFIVALRDRQSRRAFLLALAGTLGVGNIFGISAGIMIGGAGSLFWLLISSLFAMIIKYAETLLVFDLGGDRGGMASVIFKVFSRLGHIFAPTYALFSVLLALFMGSAMQSSALTDVAKQSLGLHPAISGIILIILLLPCLVGGAGKIENITEIIIPLTTIIYILMCFCTIIAHFDRVGEAVDAIISSACNMRSILGGGVSFLAIREGFSRGILSNEAGVGTSAMAHSRSQNRAPHIAGLFAMCEVVFDSSLLCMLTGIAILVSVPDVSAFETPMSLVNAALTSALGPISSYLLTAVIFAFAYATIICWYYYGMEYSSIYFGRLSRLFPILFIGFAVLSGLLSSEFILYFTDVLILLMSVLTLSAIIKKRARITELCPLNKTKKSRP